MKNSKFIVVVEGKHDIDKVSKVFDGIIFATGGTSLPKEIFNSLIHYHDMGYKIIIFTDPDYPGAYIRNKILEMFPDSIIATLPKELAKTNKKVGIEHATETDIERVLSDIIGNFNESNTNEGVLSLSDMYDLSLAGSKSCSENRYYICDLLHLPRCNAKTFLKYVNKLGLTKENLIKYEIRG